MSLHELAADLGVSRSPVHHALTRLVSEGLLTVKARRGYYVTPADGAPRSSRATRCASRSSCRPPRRRSGDVGRAGAQRASASCYEATSAAVSHADWDTANAAFHEHQVDLAGNALLSRFYRELSVNLMMQVIRGGKLEAGATSRPSTARSSTPSRPASSRAAQTAIRAHIDTGRRIALDAIEQAGGAL